MTEQDIADLRIAATAIDQLKDLFPAVEKDGIIDRLNRIYDVLDRYERTSQ